MTKKRAMEDALSEIKAYFQQWLAASNMSEHEFLELRTCKKYKLNIKDCVQNGQEGIGIFITHDQDESIGLPFWVGYENSAGEKAQFFTNTALVLAYIAGQLDKANRDQPISGSYVNSYFMFKTRAFLPQLMEYRETILFADK